jgi:large subunit ribosomal protein L23
MRPIDIIIKPIVSEKMTDLGEKLNQYGFIVNPKANKLQIKNAVEQLYNVSVESVNTMIYPGKSKRRYTKTRVEQGRTNKYKKAVVTLADGESIDFFSAI